ncbi:cytochrome P450, partial [Geopyxis carbonaria]
MELVDVSFKTFIATLVAGLYTVRRIQIAILHHRQARALGCGSPPFSPDAYLCGPRRLFDMLHAAATLQLPLYINTILSRFPGRSTVPVSDLGRAGLCTTDPANIAALATWDLGAVRDATVRFIGQGIFTQDGEDWRQSRKLLQPSFRASAVADFAMLERHLQPVWDAIDADIAAGERSDGVEMDALFHKMMLEFATEFLFGLSPQDEQLGAMFDAGTRHTILSWMFGPLHALYYPPGFRAAVKYVHAYTDRLVQRVLSSQSSGFLTAVAQLTRDPVVLRSQALNILLAGRDTTASTLSWAVYELLNNPTTFSQLRLEVATHTSGALPTATTLATMPHLTSIISETLRTHPATPWLNRTARTDTLLPRGGGPLDTLPIFVPKGTVVIYSLHGLHRRAEVWGADADTWRPDRWLEHAKPWLEPYGPNASYYAPFGAAPRACPGQALATNTIAYTLARLCQRYGSAEIGAGWMKQGGGERWVSSITGPPGGPIRVR